MLMASGSVIVLAVGVLVHVDAERKSPVAIASNGASQRKSGFGAKVLPRRVGPSILVKVPTNQKHHQERDDGVPVFAINCQVSEKPNSGPVAAP